MTIERIFTELHDWTTWPAPPERAKVPYSAADMRPAEPIPLPPEVLEQWVREARAVSDGLLGLKAG